MKKKDFDVIAEMMFTTIPLTFPGFIFSPKVAHVTSDGEEARHDEWDGRRDGGMQGYWAAH